MKKKTTNILNVLSYIMDITSFLMESLQNCVYAMTDIHVHNINIRYTYTPI